MKGRGRDDVQKGKRKTVIRVLWLEGERDRESEWRGRKGSRAAGKKRSNF